MSSFNNPFSIDRAEQLGVKLFEFYANHKNFEGLLKSKSLVIEGGRGSGKTMFFLYNSYSNKKNEAISNGLDFKSFFEKEKVIGIYFRADSNFVPAFQHKGIDEDEWTQLFGHFLNITLTKRLIEIIIDIQKELINWSEETIDVPTELSIFFEKDLTSFDQLLELVLREEIHLISYINNLNSVERPKVLPNSYLLNTVAKSLLSTSIFEDKAIHIFVDEYENLLEYQQRLINTLVKHPNPVIFDLGMRNKGLKTSETLATSEIISAPHDFNYFNFEQFTENEYEEFIIEICRKRLQKVDSLKDLNNSDYFDIKFYLGKYSYKYELSLLREDLAGSIKLKLNANIGTNESAKIMTESDDLLILRLNLVLIERGYDLNHIADEYRKWIDGKPSKYSDWLHNNKMGVVYLLCKESSRDKLYYGFQTYKSVSSGIIRFFIELCESAFKQAFRNGFSFDEPRAITAEEQTQASYHVSRYKVNDIETYTPYSNFLKRFVLLLGSVFEKLHRDKLLSEPERNHFSTDFDKLNEDSKSFLKNAELYSVLQIREETKVKTSTIDSNNVEYHLNHIYAPYFQISPRKIRSLKIDPKNLDALINGDSKKANEIANALVKGIINDRENDAQLKIDLF
ncbi:ORC-CDC6 family AAA ATPase [Flavobacterium sedimenticola]|uniref:Uncharacterized protein n=1 Tax=Flavobacterium sedimenticola TaxID=3043286 RepID=A0ABT6XS73_9FLAO|nr:hypothetical protein [Flavobacterium sedimenticola]MDI9257950.1 hypothetical protein [Flavobacterium sedimenticola]